MPRRRIRRGAPAVAIGMLLVALAAACAGGGSGPCAVLRFADGVDAQWTRAGAAVDFAPTRLCGRDGRLRVSAVFVDAMPADGAGFVPRINQTVDRAGERLFVFSESRALVPFRAIPDGTHFLVVAIGEGTEPARGFVGTSSSGSAIAYLRWRTDGVTHELAATLRPSFSEADLVALVRGVAAH